jgi:hypothetical protein
VKKGAPEALELLARIYAEGLYDTPRNDDKALRYWQRLKSEVSHEAFVQERIDEILEDSRRMLTVQADEQRAMMMMGMSILAAHANSDGPIGLTSGDNVLHGAARANDVLSAWLFYDQPEFEVLVQEQNESGEVPRSVVRDNATLDSILLCSRAARARCLMWCWAQSKSRLAVLPEGVVKLVSEFVGAPKQRTEGGKSSVACELLFASMQ